MTNFNFLPFNKNCKFKSDLSDNLVRTGMIEKNSLLSFINSVLFSTSKKYNDIKNSDDKIKFVYDFYDYITNKFIGDNNSDFKLNVINLLSSLYIQVRNGDILSSLSTQFQENSEVFNLIFELLEDDFSIILKKSLKSWNSCRFDDLRRSIVKESIRYLEYLEILDELETEKQDFIKRKLCFLFDILLDEIKINNDEPTLDIKINNDFILFISKYFDCNIYFIDATTMKPIKFDIDYSENTSIIILSFNNQHFEPLSKYIEKDKKLIKEFQPNEDILQSFKF